MMKPATDTRFNPSLRIFRHEKVPAPRQTEFLPPAFSQLDLEIGCGVGLHPIQYSQAHPDRFLIAIEHTTEKFSKFEGRLKRHAPIPNLLAVHANAISWVTHRLKEKSVDRIFILYPNPKPRWTGLPFFQRLIWILKPEGQLTLATNLEDYAAEARRQLPAQFGLELQVDRKILPLSLESGFRPRTHFEKKYLMRGETCMDLVFRKPGDSGFFPNRRF